MAENLPRLREDIKEISMSDLKDFLESIRKHSDKVGETAMRQVWESARLKIAHKMSTNSVSVFLLCVCLGTAAQNL